MSALNGVQAIVLCEDQFHYSFIYRFLISKGVQPRRIKRVQISRGSAEYQVRENFQKALGYMREHSGAKTILIAMIDTDRYDLKKRREQLLHSEELNVAPSEKSYRALILTPRRNIESWFAYMEDGTIDEIKDFKMRYRNKEPAYGKLVKEMTEIFCRDETIQAPASLLEARKEWRQFIQHIKRW